MKHATELFSWMYTSLVQIKYKIISLEKLHCEIAFRRNATYMSYAFYRLRICIRQITVLNGNYMLIRFRTALEQIAVHSTQMHAHSTPILQHSQPHITKLYLFFSFLRKKRARCWTQVTCTYRGIVISFLWSATFFSAPCMFLHCDESILSKIDRIETNVKFTINGTFYIFVSTTQSVEPHFSNYSCLK